MLTYSTEEKTFALRYTRRNLGKKAFNRQTITLEEWIHLKRRAMKGSRFLEIGCYKYLGSLAFLAAMEFNKNAILYSVDPQHNRDRQFWVRNPDVNRRWFRVISKSQDYLLDCCGQFGKRKFDLIFIDGDHRVSAVKKDLELALQLITPDGYIICHDVKSEPLWKAICEIVPADKWERHIEHMVGDHCKGIAEYHG